MSSYARRLRWIVVFVSLFPYAASASTATTYLYLNSQPGDYIGQGITQTLTPSEGTFSVSNGLNTVNVSFNTPEFSQSWHLNFGSPLSVKFAKGQYVGAQRTPFRGPTRPGIDVSGDGRGCNTDTGNSWYPTSRWPRMERWRGSRLTLSSIAKEPPPLSTVHYAITQE